MKRNTKLPLGLVMEIVSRLPAKSLLRFRCVSKQWLRLLTVDTHFINNYHLPRLLEANSTNPNPNLISLNTRKEDSSLRYLEDYTSEAGGESDVKPLYFSFPIDKNKKTSHKYCRVGGICNGLLCVTLYEESSCFPNVPSEVLIWNPLTRDHITLPLPLHIQPCDVDFGFGFDKATNQYKVVRILSCSKEGKAEPPTFQHVSVYTLGGSGSGGGSGGGGNSSWRTLPVPDFSYASACCYDYPRMTTTTVNGAPHLLVYKHRLLLIAVFDVKSEVFQEISLPVICGQSHPVKVLEIRGLLCIVIKPTLLIAASTTLEVWVMKDHGVESSWTKLFKIIPDQLPKQLRYWTLLSIACNGTITLFSNDSGRTDLLLYNSKTNSFKGPIIFGYQLLGVYTFLGSLLSPKTINAEQSRSHLQKKEEQKEGR